MKMLLVPPALPTTAQLAPSEGKRKDSERRRSRRRKERESMSV